MQDINCMSAGYRDRICSTAAREWVLVDPEGRQKIIDHMQVLLLASEIFRGCKPGPPAQSPKMQL